MSFYIALWLGKILNIIINVVDKNRGTNFAGKQALKICGNMVSKFKDIDFDKVLFITGTNGKSTSNNLINHILKCNNKTVVSNLEGANLLPGVATALIKASSLTGKLKADYFIFETDERFLPIIYRQLPAKNILITNLQKDQVQRNGDPDFIFRKLKPVMGKDMRLFINNNEPRSASFGYDNKRVVTYGVSKHGESFVKGEDIPTMPCPICGGSIIFDYYNNDGVGAFHCADCDYQSRERADYQIDNVDFENRKFTCDGISFDMPYNIPYMCYNYAAALAVVKELAGVDLVDAAPAFASFKNVGGRYEVLEYNGKTIKYMRIKQENPETVQSAINVMASDETAKMVCLGPGPLIDIVPNYTNTFYTFDCDFSKLACSDVEKYFCFSEAVCYDMANRLIYAGVPEEKIVVIETDDVDTIFDVIDGAKTDNVYLITWLHTFEGMKKKLKLKERQ